MDVLNLLIIAALVITVLALVAGIYTMEHGGGLDRKFGNKLMWIRVGLQAVVVALLALVLLLR